MAQHRSAAIPGDGAPRPLRGPARLTRGWAAAVVATLMAAGSHTLAAGHDAAPAPVVWLLTLVLAGPVCTALAGRAQSWWRLAVAVASSQVLFHWLYSWPAVPTGAPGSLRVARPGPQSGVQHELHHGAHGLTLAPPVGPGPAAPGDGLSGDLLAAHTGPSMAAAHVVAAAVTVGLLRHGEAMALRVAELAAGVLLRSPGARLARWVPARRPPGLPGRPTIPVVGAGTARLSALRLRGPPVPAFAL
ncbi:MAG TPA: hypothetical protein VIG75_02570 [Citricoccus sp.]